MISKEMEALHVKIRENKFSPVPDIIMELIAAHDTEAMLEGVRYYRSKGDITGRKMYYYDSQGSRNEDHIKTNHKLVNNWHKLLVDQKVSYLVGRPMVFTIDTGESALNPKTKQTGRLTAGNEKANGPKRDFADKIELLLGDEWDDTVADIATNASNKGTEWLHVYIDKNGYFKYAIAPAEGIIPVYDSPMGQNLEVILRYYTVQAEGKERCRVEWWARETVTIFTETGDGGFEPDTTEAANPAGHYIKGGMQQGFGKVPFIEFPNNSFRASDLEVTKTLIDEYDRAISDFANNNAEVQDIIMILKGYEATDLNSFKENLRYFKTIKLRPDPHAGVDKLELNIPFEAKRELLDRIEENIFMFGQGVNVKTDRFGNSPSGASLKFLYSLLDLKASMMERKFRRSVKRLLWFTTEYVNMFYDKDFDPLDVKAGFRKNLVQNDKEIVETLNTSRDMISDETIVERHPLIENAGYEYQKLLVQRQERMGSTVDLTDNDADTKDIDIEG